MDSLRTSREWADAVGPSLAVGEPNTLPRDRGAPASSPDPGPSPGPRSAGPSSTTTTSSSITPCSISGNSSHSGTPAPSVADLLSQLRASQSLEEPPTSTTSGAVRDGDRTLERRSPPGPSSPLNHTQNASPVPLPQSVSAHVSKSQQDVRALSFQQALPHISRLFEDPHVAESLTKVTDRLHLYMFSFHFCLSL